VRIEAGSIIGTAQGAIKRINKAIIRLYKTMAASVGSAPGAQTISFPDVLDFTKSTDPANSSVEFFTGDKPVIVPSTYDRDNQLYITQDGPFPMTVVSISAEGETFD